MKNMKFINKYISILIIGINSGILYALSVSTLTTFLKDNAVSYALIGLLSLRTLPYSFKYLWSPLVDSYKIKFFPTNFGQRKSWMIFIQLLLIIIISSIGFIDFTKNFYFGFCLFILIALLAATYDIALDAYRIESFSNHDASTGNSVTVFGFRLGLIFSGAIGLYLSDVIGWQKTFIVIAAMIIPGIIVIAFSEDKKILPEQTVPISVSNLFKQNVASAFVSFTKIPNICLILLIVAFYKASDGYLDTMLLPFLMDNGFSKTEIAGVVKTAGVIATIIGTFAGSYLVKHINNLSLLFTAEILASITNLLFLTIYYNPSNIMLLMLVNSLENFCYGITNISLITYISSLCNQRFIATHYALLISLSGLTRAILGSTSGYTLANFGNVTFFVVSSILSIPSLICLYLLRKKILYQNTLQHRLAL